MTKLSSKIFEAIHGNKLVYNTCWEDPVCDKMLLDIDTDSEIVMITSAGCNALSYLTESPKNIHCIDLNYRQNALLELKKAFFHVGDFALLKEFFGQGKHPRYKQVYTEQIRSLLPTYAQEYWDKKIHYFSGKGLRDTFYFRGTSGILAYSTSAYLKMRKGLRDNIHALFGSRSLEEQSRYYNSIAKTIWNDFLAWALNRHVVMSLAGVPKAQQQLFMNDYERGTVGFLEKQFQHVFTALPAWNNYFYHVYYKGYYSDTCCPEYLEEKNFDTLRSTVDKIETYTTSISEFLIDNPKPYSHYILLDHQDWMASNAKEALEEEWRLILQNSRIGTKILLRSAAKEIDFFPDFVEECVSFDVSLAQKSQDLDRVGTYTSTYIGTVTRSFTQ